MTTARRIVRLLLLLQMLLLLLLLLLLVLFLAALEHRVEGAVGLFHFLRRKFYSFRTSSSLFPFCIGAR